MAFRSRGVSKRYGGRGSGFRGRGFQTARGRSLRGAGGAFKPLKSQKPVDRQRPKTFDNNRFRRRREMRQPGRASSPDTFDVDLHRVEEEGLRITVENRGTDLFVADPSFYDEIQRHMSHTDEPDSRISEVGYENISDSADSDPASVIPKNVTRHQSALGFDENRLHYKSEYAARRKDSLSRTSRHSRSRSPSHGRKNNLRKDYDLKRHRRSRSRSHARSDSKNKKHGDSSAKKQRRSDSHENSSSRSQTRSRSTNHQRSRSRSASYRHSRSSERSGSKCSAREEISKSMSGRSSHSRENKTTYLQDTGSDNSDSVPPWIKDPSKAMSVEEIEKYLESKLRQAEMQSQPCPAGVSNQVREESEHLLGGTYTDPSGSRINDALGMDQSLVNSPVIKKSPPLDLYDDLPEQPRLATPPKITAAKPFKSILKNKIKTVEPVKGEKPAKDLVTSSASAVADEQPQTLIPGLASTLDIDDEDKFLYGNTEPLKPLGDGYEKKPSTETSHFEPVFTGGYSKVDPGWEVAPTKVWTGSIADEQSPEEETKKEDDNTKLDPTIQNILKSIGFNFELSKLMQQKAQSQRKTIDGGSAISAENSFPPNSSEKLTSRKGRYNRKSSLEMSYEERARRYREEQMKLYRDTATAFEPTDESSRQSQDSAHNDNQSLNDYGSFGGSVGSNLVPFDTPVNVEYDVGGSDSLHAVKLSGLQQLQSEYCVNDNNRLLGKGRVANWSDIGKKSSHSFMSHDKRPDPHSVDDVHSHESSSKRMGPRKTDEKGGDEDRGFRRFSDQGIHEAASGPRRIVLPHRDRSSAPRELKRRDCSDSYGKSADGFDGSTKKLLAMNMEDKEGLMIELEKWQNRLNMLETELIRLKQEEKEMMRKHQRLRPFNGDSLLRDNVDLQEDIKVQMTLLSRAAEINTKLLLSGRSGDMTNDVDYLSGIKEKVDTRDEKALRKVQPPTHEVNKDGHSSSDKKADLSKQFKHKSDAAKHSETEASSLEKGKNRRKLIDYEYFDPGDHWCKQCNRIFGKCQALFRHMHSTKHVDTFERPWLQETLKNSQRSSGKPKGIAVPMKGVEFMVPARAFYCVLCKEFAGDSVCAEDHLKSQTHNSKYQSFIDDNQSYEMRYNQVKTASCPLLEDVQHSSDEDSASNDLPAEKVSQKKEDKNPFGKSEWGKREKLKREEQTSKKDDSTANRGAVKHPSVNFKWKGRMPMIGKSPAYKKAASATSVECDNKKVLFMVKNRKSALAKQQTSASQQNDAQSDKECKSILKNERQGKEPVSSELFFDSTGGKGRQSDVVNLKDIALPQMPPPSPHTCYGPDSRPESSNSSALVKCKPAACQESGVLTGQQQKGVPTTDQQDPASMDIFADRNSGKDGQNVSVNDIALPAIPLPGNCYGPEAGSSNGRDTKTVQPSESSKALDGAAVTGKQTTDLVKGVRSACDTASEHDQLTGEPSSTSPCSTAKNENLKDAKITVVTNKDKDGGEPC